jgi:RNA polymerase sigma factor (TIGR02999 family)
VYAELRRLARGQLRGERRGHTLAPTALVHEACLRLLGERRIDWQDRAHFLAVTANLMRRILVSYARRHRAAKRGGGAAVTLHDDDARAEGRDVDLIALSDSLAKLEALDARQARVVELRYFAGMTIEETAEVLAVSPATVKIDWSLARAWLLRELGG